MMVSQPHVSPANRKNSNSIKESSNVKMTQEKKIKVDEVTTNGLHVPGSNWEKFKSRLEESRDINKESTETSIIKSPRKRHRVKKFDNRQEGLQVCLLLFFSFLFFYFLILNFIEFINFQF